MLEERWEYHQDCNDIDKKLAVMLLLQDAVIKAHKTWLLKEASFRRELIYSQLTDEGYCSSTSRYNTDEPMLPPELDYADARDPQDILNMRREQTYENKM